MLDRLSESNRPAIQLTQFQGPQPVQPTPVADQQVIDAERTRDGRRTPQSDRDVVEVSAEALALAHAPQDEQERDAEAVTAGQERTQTVAPAALADAPQAGEEGEEESGAEGKLSDDEQRDVQKLRARDVEVRAHEHAHSGAGGALTGAPSYGFETGPDGVKYAVSGEVSVSLGSGNTPDEKVRNAQMARRAALAPAQPSAQDLSVASEATKLESRAQAEKFEAEQEELETQKVDATADPGNAQVGAPEVAEKAAASSSRHTPDARSGVQQASDDAKREPARPQSPATGRAIDAYASVSRERVDDGSISLVA